MTEKEKREKEIIETFVSHLEGMGYPCRQVDRWPDKENRNSSDIDAIACPFAIEHTSVDALLYQRRNAAWFMEAVGKIEQELKFLKLNFRLTITIDYGAVNKGMNWEGIRSALKNWIIKEAILLADGDYVLDKIPDIPFRLNVKKQSNRPAGVFVGRIAPSDITLVNRVREQFDRKAKKLAKYPDNRKVLLFENDDIALMDEHTVMGAIRQAFPEGFPNGIDQVWYADTSISTEIVFRDFTAICTRE